MTAPMTMTNCPTDSQLLAAFADGRLDGKERQKVIEHLATCAECYDEVEMARAYADETGGEVVPMRRGWLAPAITLAATAAIAAAVFLGPVNDRIMRPRRIAALTVASKDLKERPIAARPSIAIAYKRHPTLRSGNSEKAAEFALYDPAWRLWDAAKKRPTAENLHAAGVAMLLLEDKQYRDQAVPTLEEALTKHTGRETVAEAIAAATNAELLNDLAAAYYEANKLNEARVVIDRAWQLKKSAPIAWTRATILDSVQGWKDYLAIDSNSEWATEAREKLAVQ